MPLQLSQLHQEKQRRQNGPEVIKEKLCRGKLQWKDLVFLCKCSIKQEKGLNLQGAPSGSFWQDTKFPLDNPKQQNKTWSISHLPEKSAPKDIRSVHLAMTWRHTGTWSSPSYNCISTAAQVCIQPSQQAFNPAAMFLGVWWCDVLVKIPMEELESHTAPSFATI